MSASVVPPSVRPDRPGRGRDYGGGRAARGRRRAQRAARRRRRPRCRSARCRIWPGRRTPTPTSSRSPPIAGRPGRAPALGRARDGPGRPGAVPRHAARHRAADRGRLLLRLPAVRARSPRMTWPPSRRRWPRSSRPASASRAARSTTTTRAPSSPVEKFKLELIGLKCGRDRRGGHRGRRRRADHVRQPATPRPATGSGPTCAAARTCPPPGASRRSS